MTIDDVPMPLRGTVNGLPAELLATVKVPVTAPVLTGEKKTLMAQLVAGASVAPQPLVALKLPPVETTILLKVAAPALLRVTVCGALVVPFACDAKDNDIGETIATGIGLMGGAGGAPVPLNATTKLPPEALLAIVSTPVRAPVAVGLKVTPMAQVAAGASVAPQLLDALKFAPVETTILLKLPAPVLLSVTVCVTLTVPVVCDAKDNDAGEAIATGIGLMGGAGDAPVPLSATAKLPPEALLAIVSTPVTAPVTEGLKITAIEQVAAGASVVPQLLVELKLAPVDTTISLSTAVPELLSVTVWGALIFPVVSVAKDSVSGETAATGAGAASPVPLNVTVRLPPVELLAIVKVPVREPTTVGVNVTLMVQVAAAASDEPQSSAVVKSPLFETSIGANGAEPEFFNVTVCTELDAPIVWATKANAAGEIDAAATRGGGVEADGWPVAEFDPPVPTEPEHAANDRQASKENSAYDPDFLLSKTSFLRAKTAHKNAAHY